MRLERLMLRDFRNYEQAEVSFSPQVNVLLGRNAQGKTNLLEAIYLLAIGKSFRTNNDRELARHGTEAFKVTGDFLGAGGVKLMLNDVPLSPLGREGEVVHDRVFGRSDLQKNP